MTRLEFLPSPGVTKFHPHIARNVLRNDHRPQQRCEKIPPPPPRCFGESIAGQCFKQRQQRDVSNFGWKLETPLSKSPCNLIYFTTSWMTTRSPGDRSGKMQAWQVPRCSLITLSFDVRAPDVYPIAKSKRFHLECKAWTTTFQLDCYSQKSNQMSNEKKVPNRCSGLFTGWHPTQLCGDSEKKTCWHAIKNLFVTRDLYHGFSRIPT